MLGGNIVVDGGQLNALGGRIEIAAVSDNGEVSFSLEEMSLILPDDLDKADVEIANNSLVNVAAGDGGNVIAQADNVDVNNASFILAGIDSSLGNESSQGGDIQIEATGTVNVLDDSLLVTTLLGAGAGGNINVLAQDINLLNGGRILAAGSSSVSRSTITLVASDAISLGDSSFLNNTPSSISSFDESFFLPDSLPLEDLEGGDGVDINLIAGQIELFDGALISSSATNNNSGNIDIVVDGSLFAVDGSSISASTLGRGNAGDVFIEASEQVLFEGTSEDGQIRSGAFSAVGTFELDDAEGNGGDVVISAGSLTLLDGAALSASTFGIGDAGNVLVDVQDEILLDGISENGQFNSGILSEVGFGAEGNGGSILLAAGNLRVDDGATLSASTLGTGNAGNVFVNVQDEVLLDGTSEDDFFRSGLFSTVGSGAVGTGGDVELIANSLSIFEGAGLSASTFGLGNAGNVLVFVRDHVNLDGTSDNDQFSSGISSILGFEAEGNGGSVEVFANTLQVTDGATLNASTLGLGDAGNIMIDVTDTAVFSGTSQDGQLQSSALSQVNATAVGNGGNVEIRSGNNVDVVNGALLSVSTFGIGDAGSISIDGQDNVSIDGTSENGQLASTVSAVVDPDAIGSSGDIGVSTGLLLITGGAQLSITGGEGDIQINVDDGIIVSGESADGNFSSTVSVAGDGNIFVNSNGAVVVLDGGQLETSSLSLSGGNVEIVADGGILVSGVGLNSGTPSSIDTSALSEGTGGNISIETSNLSVIDGAVFSAQTQGSAEGTGGNIIISLDALELLNGGRLSTQTDAGGSSGRIAINAKDNIVISGRDSQGDVSGLFVTFGPSSLAGEVELQTGRLELNRQGQIFASAPAGSGGNLTLEIEKILLLRNGSLISVTAGSEQANGNGGNIEIIVPFIIALPEENSDITANAFEGSGGQINIIAEGVFGIAPRPFNTKLSDITASSERGVSGVVTLSSPDTSSIQNNLTDLPDALVDSEVLVADSCVARSQNISGTFAITGSNLAQSPNDTSLSTYATDRVSGLDELSNSRDVTSHANVEIAEPHRIYQLANSRLVLSRECS